MLRLPFVGIFAAPVATAAPTPLGIRTAGRIHLLVGRNAGETRAPATLRNDVEALAHRVLTRLLKNRTPIRLARLSTWPRRRCWSLRATSVPEWPAAAPARITWSSRSVHLVMPGSPTARCRRPRLARGRRRCRGDRDRRRAQSLE